MSLLSNNKAGAAATLRWFNKGAYGPVVLVCLAAAALFAAFPTRRYYWDGVLFALKIEHACADGFGTLIHPNHLLFSVVGFAVYWPLHMLWPSLRALAALEALDVAASISVGLLLGRMLLRLCGSGEMAGVLTGIFLFGAEWWKFSVDADAYILTALFLLLAARALLFQSKHALFGAAIFHCAAMLMHELGVLFLPVVWVFIANDKTRTRRRRLLIAAIYTGAMGAVTLAAYYSGFLVSRVYTGHGFLDWIASHSSDSSFTVHPAYIAAGTVKSYVQLFLGGRPRLFVEFFQPWMIVVAVVLVLSAVAFVISALKGLQTAGELPREGRRALQMPAFQILLAWILSYFLFLLVWLPRNTFYKLLLWPAIILAAGFLLKETSGRTIRHWLIVQVCWNFLFFVYPYSRVESNPVLEFARAAEKVWAPGQIILFRTFDTDNWTIRYFTPQTIWKSLDCAGDDCIGVIERERRGSDVWLDPTAIGYLESASEATRAWLERNQAGGQASECCGAKYTIRFLRMRRE